MLAAKPAEICFHTQERLEQGACSATDASTRHRVTVSFRLNIRKMSRTSLTATRVRVRAGEVEHGSVRNAISTEGGLARPVDLEGNQRSVKSH